MLSLCLVHGYCMLGQSEYVIVIVLNSKGILKVRFVIRWRKIQLKSMYVLLYDNVLYNNEKIEANIQLPISPKLCVYVILYFDPTFLF